MIAAAPQGPEFERTDIRHAFLRAVAGTPNNWSGPFMTMEDLGERAFAVAVTTSLGERLNAAGAVLLGRWNNA
ncbi:MAG TPA: hypothetical protein VGL46_12515 [Pseudonocardiaceae bacterium]|jgi:hypothetical protein